MPWRHEMSAWFFVVASNFRPFLKTEKLSRSLLGRPGTFVWNQSYSNLQTFAWQTWNICMEPVIIKPSNLCLADLDICMELVIFKPSNLYFADLDMCMEPVIFKPSNHGLADLDICMEPVIFKPSNLCLADLDICMEPVIFKPSNLCLADLEHLYGTSHNQTFKPFHGRPGTFVWNQS